MTTENANAGAQGGVGLTRNRIVEAFGHYEPHLEHRLLPRCYGCGARHPLAETPPSAALCCRHCGAVAAEIGPAVAVPAVVTDARFSVGNTLMRVGAWLNRLATRL